MNRSGKVLGIVFVILGALFLLKNFNIMNPFFQLFTLGNLFGKFWPSLFLLIPGLLFHYGYFSGRRKDPGLLVPGGILLVLGVVFQFNMLFGGWDITWPAYIFSVAFGLFELYTFGNREKGLLVPVGILTGLSVIFFFSFSLKELLSFSTRQYIVPVILIVIGLVVLFGGRRKKDF
jgi:hypothetical protein